MAIASEAVRTLLPAHRPSWSVPSAEQVDTPQPVQYRVLADRDA